VPFLKEGKFEAAAGCSQRLWHPPFLNDKETKTVGTLIVGVFGWLISAYVGGA
jgi:hypothetical protein